MKEYSDELVLCFRGNNAGSEAVCIYYNNHLVYKIGDNGNITVSFNHARYSKEYKDLWRKIIEYGFIPTDKRNPEEVPKINLKQNDSGSYSANIRNNGYITGRFQEGMKDLECVKNIYMNCLRPMLIDYFNPDKTKDFFKDAVSKGIENSVEFTQSRNKGKLLEKIRQQQLFCAMKFTQNGLFIFDMEFSQPSGLDKKEYGQEIKKQPDMLAVKFNEDGRPINYFLVEVKCKTEACTGKSGLMEHLKAMMKYPEKYKKVRRREAALIMSQYKELGLYPFFKEIDIDKYENLSVEIMLIFTDEAVSVVSKFKEEFENDIELSSEYEVELCGDMGIHLPSCKGLEIVEVKKN